MSANAIKRIHGLKETQFLSIQDILIVKGFAMHYQEISNRVSQLEVYENPLQQGKRMDSLDVTSYILRVRSTDWKSSVIVLQMHMLA